MTTNSIVARATWTYFALGCCVALGQWSDDAAMNLVVADRSGEQTQPKIHVNVDGSSYVSWFDNSAGGYDAYLQLLDADGNALWPVNGVLIADRGFSSTQDYDLDGDAAGNAFLTFRDDRFGGTQITVTRVNRNGVQTWGDDGVQVTSGGDFVAAPKVAVTTDGGCVVAWTNNSNVRLQKLDATGATVWGDGVTIPAIGGDNTSASDLDATSDGGAILSMVRGFLAPKHLHAQKFDADGNALWGEMPLAVFDGGALQTANFPQFVTDGDGGGVFAWYSVGPLQCHAQRVLSDGTEAFAHDGVVVSTAARSRTLPDVSFDRATQETFVFWREEMGGPFPEFGVYGQKFDAAGNRMWTDSGVEVTALTTTELGQVRQVNNGDGTVVSWVETLSFGDQRIHASRLDGSGNTSWTPSAADISTVASSKSRLVVAAGLSQSTILLWADGRNDSNDVFIQNIDDDGALAPSCFADLDGNGVTDIADFAAMTNCIDTGCTNFDLNNDGNVDWADAQVFALLFGACP